MSSEIAIKVEGLSKCYHIYDQPRDRLKQMFCWGRHQYYREFWALKDVSFEVPRGETVGIIGQNGSGKSTLLQMVCGTLNPTAGMVTTQGRVAALLELGSGFNPQFTGRENVYMNATVLGLSPKEIEARIEEIEAFANIGEFIDQPIMTYSSGMVMRLAFAVQASVEPDVLIVDEALAVGDAKFQAKCFNRLALLKQNGTTILLVTHSTEQIVTHCTQAILLDGGRILQSGCPRRVVYSYMDKLFGRGGPTAAETSVRASSSTSVPVAELPVPPIVDVSEDVFSTRPGYNLYEHRWGDQAALLLDYCMKADGDTYPAAVQSGARIDLWVSAKCQSEIDQPVFGMTIRTKQGITVYARNSRTAKVPAFDTFGRNGSVLILRLSFTCRLGTGDYFISLGLASNQGQHVVPHDRRYDAIHLQVLPQQRFIGMADLDCDFQVEEIA